MSYYGYHIIILTLFGICLRSYAQHYFNLDSVQIYAEVGGNTHEVRLNNLIEAIERDPLPKGLDLVLSNEHEIIQIDIDSNYYIKMTDDCVIFVGMTEHELKTLFEDDVSLFKSPERYYMDVGYINSRGVLSISDGQYFIVYVDPNTRKVSKLRYVSLAAEND